MKQLGLGLDLSTKKMRKCEFLEDMERVVPWLVLVNMADALLHGDEVATFSEADYQSVHKRPEAAGRPGVGSRKPHRASRRPSLAVETLS